MKVGCSWPRGTLGISGWGCAAETLEPLAYTRASSAEFCYPIPEQTPQISPSIDTVEVDLRKFKLADLIFLLFEWQFLVSLV